MKKAWQYRKGVVLIKGDTDPLLSATLTKVGWNKWRHHYYRQTDPNLDGWEIRTDKHVQTLIDNRAVERVV
jgi:hypothetical protein